MTYTVSRTESLAEARDEGGVAWLTIRGTRIADLSDDMTRVERTRLDGLAELHLGSQQDDRDTITTLNLPEVGQLIDALTEAQRLLRADAETGADRVHQAVAQATTWPTPDEDEADAWEGR